jgi:uncharacterized protein
MLLSFRVSNFLSIKEEQEFSFLRNSPLPSQAQPAGRKPWDASVGTLAGIFGANASGKSNVLEAINFMRMAVGQSYRSWSSRESIPVSQFALSAKCKKEPSLFEAVFQIDGTRYQYGFRITEREVVGEWLYAYSTHRRQVWFERDVTSGEVWYFGKSFTGRNKVIADLTRPTSLFLSSAVANNHKMAGIVEHYFRSHLRAASPDDKAARTRYTQSLSSQKAQWGEVVELMQFADLGIRDVRVRQDAIDAEQRETLTKVFRAIDADAKVDSISEILDRVANKVEFSHSAGRGRKPVYLPLEAESMGTQIWFALAGSILRAINNGDTLTIDEIDASLHPHLTSEILKTFRDPKKNPKQAQLLFTSHDTTLLGGWLGERDLTRDQVWFTEKKSDGATVLYPLTDFSPRKTENLERGYLQGRYGAIPYLDSSLIGNIAEQVSTDQDHEKDSELEDLTGLEEEDQL